jgi:molecular chaperone DnaK (HSP70)
MRLGIDFGTTRTVVAAADRGNYPVVTFETGGGEFDGGESGGEGGCEWRPSLCAVRGDELRTGHAAKEVLRDPDWSMCRSLKRMLATCGPGDLVLGRPVTKLLAESLRHLRKALVESSNLDIPPGEKLEVAIAVPAGANANQRMITADAFREAGFHVVRMLDEPSAAALEYAWRRPADAKVRKRHVAVYDLGGGTFDASILSMGDSRHEVLTTEGLSRVGGDDFDEALLAVCLEQIGLVPPPPGPDRDRLLEMCREEKERFTASTRKLKPELFGDKRDAHLAVKVADYEERIRPLVQRTFDALDMAVARAQALVNLDFEKNTVVYQVGGGSQLPTVGRLLKEKFGRRVWKSPYAHASVAVGLAIAAESPSEVRVENRFTRYFGVWREADGGRNAWFDPVFPKDTPLPHAPPSQPLTVTRRYRPAHNVGHFRFVECSRLHADGSPAGEITPWGDVRFALQGAWRDRPLEGVDVVRLPEGNEEVEERYCCDADGNIEVNLVNLTQGYRKTYRMGLKAA